MVAGFDAIVPAVDGSAVGALAGVASAGIWILRLRRIAAVFRLVALLLVLVAGAVVVGSASGVLRVDVAALMHLFDAAARGLAWAFRRVVAAGGA